MNSIENHMANLEDMCASYLTGESIMFSVSEMVCRKEMLNGIKEIGKLNAGEECLMELNARHAELENRIAIFDEITNAKLSKGDGGGKS